MPNKSLVGMTFEVIARKDGVFHTLGCFKEQAEAITFAIACHMNGTTPAGYVTRVYHIDTEAKVFEIC